MTMPVENISRHNGELTTISRCIKDMTGRNSPGWSHWARVRNSTLDYKPFLNRNGGDGSDHRHRLDL